MCVNHHYLKVSAEIRTNSQQNKAATVWQDMDFRISDKQIK